MYMFRRVYTIHVYVKSVRVYVQKSVCMCICSGECTLYMYMLSIVYVYMFRRVYTVHVNVKKSVCVYVQESVQCTLYVYMFRRVYVYSFRRVYTVHVYVK